MSNGGWQYATDVAGYSWLMGADEVGTLTALKALRRQVVDPAICFAAILINAGVQSNHVVSQRAVLCLAAEAASRLNAIYIATFFVGGATGSAASAFLLQFAWTGVGVAGGAAAALALGCGVALPSVPRISTVTPNQRS